MPEPGPPPLAAFLGGPGTQYAEWLPPGWLAPWVAVSWRLRVTRPVDLRILPDGCVDVIDGDVVGPFTRAAVVRLQAGRTSSGVRLRPGACPALFGVPATELLDARVPLADVLRSGGRQVPRAAPLSALAADAAVPDPLAAMALRSAADPAALARDSGYSPRQLRRRLSRATGHGPKVLQRIGRMQALLRAGRGESWARTAVEHGYYDEAHMAADVRALAGATPHALLRTAVSS